MNFKGTGFEVMDWRDLAQNRDHGNKPSGSANEKKLVD
jgi:hypothetical protein